ncbi:iron chelate uptake ABC transporter family permease subunit [uncultured Bartonella sp.]|uniref:FecCD family ABC transporter permease n=1 Tax=uncultured Bartonella sp. TaxID=104108 RepID=UPI0026163F41|nr:iron chelate uptake ABC transporter family permease subunit [uncultured Bartonella sp.]
MSMTRTTIICCLAACLLLSAIIVGAAIGEISISFSTFLKTIANNLCGAGYEVDIFHSRVIWLWRLPRAVVGACCGAGLAMCGVILQALLRNPLAEPYLLGISSGAGTGAALVTAFGMNLSVLSLSTGALIGGLLSFFFVVFLAYHSGRNATAIILAGIASAMLFNALTALILMIFTPLEGRSNIFAWMIGNLSGARWNDAALAFPLTVMAFLIFFAFSRILDAFVFGTRAAASLGISVKYVSMLLITIVALVTAVMVSIMGTISFVGLVVPHAARLIVGVRHRLLIPASALTGALFMIAADVVSRIIVPGLAFPVGIVTALIGAPLFALLLVRQKGN